MTGVRLDQLRLAPWGCFENLEIDFGPSGSVDLVCGPNAAGKTTMTRAVPGFLFGIEARCPDAHTFEYQDLRIGAKVGVAEEQIDLVRRKGRTGTLADPTGELLPDEVLSGRLGGLSREVFEALFLINNAALRAGGAELLQGKGEVGASLFAAAAGIATLHNTVERLDASAKNLFNPKGRKDPLHHALRELRETEKVLRAATLRPRKHQEMEAELQKTDADCNSISREVQELRAEQAELIRNRKVAPLVERHAEVQERLEALDGTPELPGDARERRIAAEVRLQGAERTLSDAQKKGEELASQIDQVAVDDDLVLRAEEIRSVFADGSVIAKAGQDKSKLENQVSVAQEKVERATETVGVDVDGLEGLKRPESVQREMDEALRSHSQLVERKRAAQEAVLNAEEGFANATANVVASTDSSEVNKLEAALRAAQKAGPLELQQLERRAEATRCLEAAEDALKRLKPGPGRLPELQTLAVPRRNEIEAWLSQDAQLEQEAKGVRLAQDRLADESRQLDQKQDELGIGRRVQGPEALEAARAARETSWNGIRASIDADASPDSSQMDGYEAQVTEADSVADNQVAASAELERAAQIEVDRRRILREGQALDVEANRLGQDRADAQRAWTEMWNDTGFEAPAPKGALNWLEQREEILKLSDLHKQEQAKERAFEEQMAAHRKALVTQLKPWTKVEKGCSFSEVVEVAEATVTEATAAIQARVEARRIASDAERNVQKARDDVLRAGKAFSAWEASWPSVLDAVGLPSSTTPEDAQEIARAVSEGLEQLARQRELERRIAGIDRDHDAYSERVKRLAIAIAPDLQDTEPQLAAGQLMQRLTASEAALASRDALADQNAKANDQLTMAEAELAQAKDEIAALQLAAGCEEVEQLPELEERAGQVQDLRRDLHELEEQIVKLGEARFDALAAEVAEFDRADAELRIPVIDEQIEELSTKRDQLKEKAGAAQAALRAAELDLVPVTAREDIELIRTDLKIIARNYAKAKLGALVVRRAMERYRRHHENPLLERANELFARITLGSFVELFVDHDEQDGAILVGRQRDDKLKRVEQMSSGPREQLFLALRIAAIERYVASAQPVPVVFDDAFLESDDDRSKKIFETLLELAERTQVIVLTHRRHQAELGRQVLGDRLAIVQLPDAAPTLRATSQPALESTAA